MKFKEVTKKIVNKQTALFYGGHSWSHSSKVLNDSVWKPHVEF